ncbi:MAG: C-GCAxxG-C-C family protein, partial [Methanobacterium sp.]
NCKNFTGNNERKDKTYAMVRQFSDKFKSMHGSMDCKTLLNCDLKTEEGRRYMKENNLSEKVCNRCIADSITIIEELIKD